MGSPEDTICDMSMTSKLDHLTSTHTLTAPESNERIRVSKDLGSPRSPIA